MNSFVAVVRFGTLVSYRWEVSAPLSKEEAAALVRKHLSGGHLALRWPAGSVQAIGLPEGWIYGKTDAECIRTRLAEIEQDRQSAQDGYDFKGSSIADLSAANERLDVEEEALRLRLGEMEGWSQVL